MGLMLVALGGLAYADGQLGGPVAGYTAGPSRLELRAILGVPGALHFSQPLTLPEGTTQLRMAPGQDFALVERKGTGPAVLVLSAGAVDHLTPLDGVLAAADWVAFSTGGVSAVLFSSLANRLQVVTGLPGSPCVALDLDASSLPEAPQIAAAGDDASLVLIASGNSVYAVSPQGAAQLVLSGGQIQAVAVLRNGTDAVVADAAAGSISLVANASVAPVSRVLASGLEEIGPIYPSPDGVTLFVARPGAQAISSIDLSSGQVRDFQPAAAPATLTPLRNRDTFLISTRPRQPGWIFYRDGDEGRSVFIPALTDETPRPPRGGGR